MNTSSLPPADGFVPRRHASFGTGGGLSVGVGYSPDGTATDAKVTLGHLSLLLPAARLAAAVKQTSGIRRLTGRSAGKPHEFVEDPIGQLEFAFLDFGGAGGAEVALRNYLLGREGRSEDEAELTASLDERQFLALVEFLDGAVRP